MTLTSLVGTKLRAAAGICGLLALAVLAPPNAHGFLGDFDGDTFTDGFEFYSGSDGTSALSTPESATLIAAGLAPPLGCADGFDNDGDGLIDLADPGCLNADGDTFFGIPLDDTVEANLGSLPLIPLSTPETWFLDAVFFPFTCFNGIDDDLDGPFDFTDFGCFPDVDLDGFPAAFGDSEGFFFPNTSGLFGTNDCADGVDNDGDGLVDLLDPDCLDNDGDGVANTVDTEGPQGTGSSAGVGGGDDCFDLVDNDGDGLVDGFEPNCALCFGAVPTLIGTAGNDNLVGTAGIDVIMGLEGDDRIRGLDGDDYICAGPGNDRAKGNNGNDYVSGSDGNDIVIGNQGNDVLYGDAGDDKVKGNAGTDTLYGGVGDDLIVGGPDGDFALGGAGNDRIRGSGGDDGYLGGDAGADDIRGGGGNDVIFGDAGPDFLRGNGGNDTILGGDDGDNLAGGGGVDLCDGQGSLLDVAPGASCETLFNVP